MWADKKAAAATSDALLFGGVPAFAALALLGAGAYDRGASKGWLSDWGANLGLVLEAASTTLATTSLVKYAVARQRPFAAAGQGEGDRDENLSFFSGHTSATFAAITAAGTLASLRGYRLAPLVWGAGLPLAAFTGVLRIGADKHWATDVLTGAAVGSATGVLVPLLLHHPGRSSFRMAVVPMGVGAQLVWHL